MGDMSTSTLAGMHMPTHEETFIAKQSAGIERGPLPKEIRPDSYPVGFRE
jgi:hypothetical protein